MDAIVMLVKDHQIARKAMEKIMDSPLNEKKGLFSIFKRELELHDQIADRIFYPAVLANPKTAGLPPADKSAQLQVKKALAHLESLRTLDPGWMPVFKAMREKLLQYMAAVESHFLVNAREAIDEAQLAEIGKRMMAEKERCILDPSSLGEKVSSGSVL